MLFVMSGVFMQVTMRQQIICIKTQHSNTNEFLCMIVAHLHVVSHFILI